MPPPEPPQVPVQSTPANSCVPRSGHAYQCQGRLSHLPRATKAPATHIHTSSWFVFQRRSWPETIRCLP
eukprot:2947049-Amphidinium_carterae.1